MTVPAGGEIAIFDSEAKTDQARVAVTVDVPTWTAQVQDLFGSGSAPDLSYWIHSQLGGDVLVDSGSALIRSKGGPLYEWMIGRALWFPNSESQPFELEINATFPQSDPKYSPMIIVGGVDNTLGDQDEPLIIWQLGQGVMDAFPPPTGTTGDIQIFSNGAVRETFSSAATQEYILQWDPAKAVNANTLRLTRGGVEKFAVDSASTPRYIAIGWVWPTLTHRATAVEVGAIAGTNTLLDIQDVTTRQLGVQGYESAQTFPGWTSANAGGTTIDTAAEGERWTEDGRTWAIIPADQIVNVHVEKARNVPHETASVTLAPASASTPATQNLFQGDLLLNQHVVIDFRTLNDAGTATTWKRKHAGKIRTIRTSGSARGTSIAFDTVSRASDIMDMFLMQGLRGEGTAIEGTEASMTLDAALEKLVGIGNKQRSGPLGVVPSDIRAATNLLLSDLGGGGQQILSAFLGLIDRTGHEFLISYSTSGTAQYGQIEVHGWNLGTGTGGYTWHGPGSASSGNYVALELLEDARGGPGMVNLRQNLPTTPRLTKTNTFSFPLVGRAPSWPYPPGEPVMSDSVAFARDASASAVVQYVDTGGTTITGANGVHYHRYRIENAHRRMVTLDVVGHCWPDLSDEIDIDDPDFTGLTTAESWVIDSLSFDYGNGKLSTRMVALTSDWVGAIRRALEV